MKRREFVKLLAGTTTAAIIGSTSAAATSFDAISEINKLRI